MELEIPTEIICSIISAAISWIVSRETSKHEIKKLKLAWAHEEAASFNDTFEAMADAVTQFAKLGSDTKWREALAEIAKVQSNCPTDLTYSMDALYNVVSHRQMKGAEVALSKAIAAKRIYDRSKSYL